MPECIFNCQARAASKAKQSGFKDLKTVSLSSGVYPTSWQLTWEKDLEVKAHSYSIFQNAFRVFCVLSAPLKWPVFCSGCPCLWRFAKLCCSRWAVTSWGHGRVGVASNAEHFIAFRFFCSHYKRRLNCNILTDESERTPKRSDPYCANCSCGWRCN